MLSGIISGGLAVGVPVMDQLAELFIEKKKKWEALDQAREECKKEA